jgi:polar amino acid transport system substrate-binding protein
VGNRPGLPDRVVPLQAGVPLTVELVAVEYPPLEGQALPHGGILTRIVTEAYAKEEVAVKITWVPNNRAISGVMNGLYDGSFGWAHAPDRDEKLLYSTHALFNFRMVFFERRGEKHPWKTLEDLAPYRIGATMGNHYSDEFSKLQANGKLKVDEASAEAFNMKKLASRRIDLFPMEQEAGRMLVFTTLPASEQAKITFQSNAIWEVPVYVVIRRNLPLAQELIDRFDKGYQALVDSGRLKPLIEETRQAIREQPQAP